VTEPVDPAVAGEAAHQAIVKVDKLAVRNHRLGIVVAVLLLVVSLSFNVLNYTTDQRASDRVLRQQAAIAQTLKIVQTVTGPDATIAARRQLYCVINRLDFDTGHGPLDRPCGTIIP
jgi:hypothetical protein